MATTRAILTPWSAEMPSANFPELKFIHSTARRPVLAFDASTKESCYWTLAVPQGWTSAFSLIVSYAMDTATTGGIRLDAEIEAVTSGDATDLDAAESLDTANSASDTGVPGTAGYMEQVTITLTNNDSSAAADYLRIKVSRDVAHADDTAAGDMFILVAELRDSA